MVSIDVALQLRSYEAVGQFQELFLVMTIAPQFFCVDALFLAFIDQLLMQLTQVIERAKVIGTVAFHSAYSSGFQLPAN